MRQRKAWPIKRCSCGATFSRTDFSKATVITLFLLPDLNIKLRPKILDMKPGTRVVSNSFTMQDWQSDQSVTASEKEGCQSYCTAYLWIVPAKVEGKWKLGEEELTLKQNFQMVSGSLNGGDKTVSQITKGSLRGDHITFTAGGSQYTGTVNGNTMKGTVKSGARQQHALHGDARRDVGLRGLSQHAFQPRADVRDLLGAHRVRHRILVPFDVVARLHE